jgi:hypothetical protein
MKSEKWYKAVSKPRPQHVREAVSKAQKGRKHKPNEGFQRGHEVFGGEATRFSKGNIGICPKEKRFRKHSMAGTKFYLRWSSMNQRCYNKNYSQYNDYGGRGIGIEWETFEDFQRDMYESYVKHVNTHGERNTRIERINNDGNYSRDNCRWATCSEQMRNRRNNKMITHNGITMCQADWANKLGIKWCTLYKRIKNHGLEVALTMRKKV